MIYFIVIVIYRNTSSIFQNLVIFCIMVYNLRVTWFLSYQCGSLDVFRCVLPYTICFIIPNGTNRLSNKPSVRCIILFYSVFIIVVVDVVDLVLINRETYRSIPSKVLVLNIGRIKCNFKALVLYFTQVSHNRSKSREARQTLTHNHVSGLLEIIIHVGCQSSVKERKVQTNVPCFCLFPFQVRSSQAAHIKRINHIGITILVVHHVSSCQSQVSQCRIYITEFTVTVGTP